VLGGLDGATVASGALGPLENQRDKPVRSPASAHQRAAHRVQNKSRAPHTMADLQKIVDDLSKLTVLEAADLAKKLKEKWSSPPASAVLFGRRERTRTEPLQRGEGLFEFYDRSASPGYDEFRAVVNGWLARMPTDAANDLISRMQYGGDREFGASLVELSL